MTQTRLPRVFIIEGIPGSSKNTLSRALLDVFHQDTNPVYYYPEEAVGFAYNHMYWPGITKIRLDLLEGALDFVEQELLSLPHAVFVFNRFHLSLSATLDDSPHDPQVAARYEQIIDRLRRLNVLVLLLELEKWKLASVLHPERVGRELVWKLFLNRRVEESPYTTPQELYAAQQEQLNLFVREQGLPYQSGTLSKLLGIVASL